MLAFTLDINSLSYNPCFSKLCCCAGEIKTFPVLILQRKSHHSPCVSNIGFVTPAIYPGLNRKEVVNKFICPGMN